MASRVVTRHYDSALAPVGLSTSSYSILSRTAREGPLPLGALAARLAMDRTTLSRELAPLVDAGLVEAEPDDAFADDPDELWRTVLHRKGGPFELMVDMPFDPGLN